MKNNHRNNCQRRALGRFALLSVSLVAGTAITAAAQDKNDAGTKPGGSGKKTADFLTKGEAPAAGGFLNGWSLAPSVGLNIRTTFKSLGGFTTQTAVGAAIGGVDHNYDDGFNRVDTNVGLPGDTWNWGFSNVSQTPPFDNTVRMNSSSSAADLTSQSGSDYKLGLEVRYSRQIGVLENLRWGIEGVFSWHDLSAEENHSLAGTVTRITDTYSLNNIPTPAPFTGTAGGPGPLISDIPARTPTVIPGGAVVTGQSKLDAALFAIKLGPQVEWRPSPASRWGLTLNAGLAAAIVNSEFTFSESVTIPSMGPGLQPGVSATQTRAGSGSTAEVLLGGYAGLSASYKFTDRLSLIGAGQYQNLGTFSQTVAGKKAEIELGNTILLSLGLRYSF